MKKLVFSPTNGFKPSSNPSFPTRVLFYSTQQTQTPKPSPPMKAVKRDKLYDRISTVRDPRVSIVPILDQWVQQGKTVGRLEIVHLIKQLRLFKRFKHALEISEWMSDRKYFLLSPGDIAVRLDLITKVHGIEHAERYFENIPKKSKAVQVYNGLLSCYAQEKSIEKAEALMQQMRELEFAMSPLVYNVLLKLYSQVGQYEKLDILMEEMEEKGVGVDKFSFCIRLNAYAATSDIDGMEITLQRMRVHPEVIMDWNCYVIAANGFIKAGLIEKGLEMLKKSEELITGKKKRAAYDCLLTMYAGAGRKDHLYRIWKLYKSSEKVCNTSYLCMIGSLLKLHDIAGAENVLEEWEAGDTSNDFRVPNLLIAAYCNNGLLENAERLVRKEVGKGNKPYPNTWDCLATGYVTAKQLARAVKTMKAALLASRPGWKPNRDTVASCLVYLKDMGNVEKAEEFVSLLGSGGHISKDECERLQDYIDNKTTEFQIMNEMDGDSLENDDEDADEIAMEAT